MQRIWIVRLLAGLALALHATACGEPTDCASESEKLKSWTVRNFDFHASYLFTTPSHQNSWGYVNFTLENPVLDYKPVCSAMSDQLSDFFYGNFPYKCTGVPDGDEAIFTFSRPNNVLHLNQTWHCPDGGSGFDAVGGTKLNLHCKDVSWKNPHWEYGTGEFYSTRYITCDHVTVSVPIKKIHGVS